MNFPKIIEKYKKEKEIDQKLAEKEFRDKIKNGNVVITDFQTTLGISVELSHYPDCKKLEEIAVNEFGFSRRHALYCKDNDKNLVFFF